MKREQNGTDGFRTPLELIVRTNLEQDLLEHIFSIHLESCSKENPPNSNETMKNGFFYKFFKQNSYAITPNCFLIRINYNKPF